MALAAAVLGDKVPPPQAEPSCAWVAHEVIPEGFQIYNGVRFSRAAYEVDVLMCGEARVVVRR